MVFAVADLTSDGDPIQHEVLLKQVFDIPIDLGNRINITQYNPSVLCLKLSGNLAKDTINKGS